MLNMSKQKIDDILQFIDENTGNMPLGPIISLYNEFIRDTEFHDLRSSNDNDYRKACLDGVFKFYVKLQSDNIKKNILRMASICDQDISEVNKVLDDIPIRYKPSDIIESINISKVLDNPRFFISIVNQLGLDYLLSLQVRISYTELAEYNAINIIKSINESTHKPIPFKDIVSDNPMHIACEQGNVFLVNYLLKHKNILDTQNYYGETPIFNAIKYNHIDIVKLLMENNFRINIKNYLGNTAFLYACKHGRKKIIKTMIKKDISIDEQNDVGRTSLMYLIINKDYTNFKKLINKNPNLTICDSYNQSALDYARLSNDAIFVDEILKRKAWWNKALSPILISW